MQYGGAVGDSRMMLDHGMNLSLGNAYMPGTSQEMHFGAVPFSQPPLGYSIVPMMVQMPRIAPRELPPFVHWKDKKKPRSLTTIEDASVGSGHCDDDEEEEEAKDGRRDPKDSASGSRHAANARRHPGEVCKFFIKHGSCAYGTMCKFKHPVDMAPLVQYNSVGLPRRPGSHVCKFFVKTGRCSYGHTCKFDHPEVVTYQYNQHSQHQHPFV